MNTESSLNYILAGGEGMRLRPLTEDMLKPLLPIGKDHRCIDFSLNQSKIAGLKTIVAGYYQYNDLEKYLKNGNFNGVLVKDSHLTGDGSIYEHIDLLNNFRLKEILLSPADHVHDINYQALIEAHRRTHAKATLVVVSPTKDNNHEVCVNSEFRVVSYCDFTQGKKDALHATGVYCFDYMTLISMIDTFLSKNDNNIIDVRKMFIRLKTKGEAYVYHHLGHWRDIGTLDRYYEENMNLALPNERNMIIGKNNIAETAVLNKCVVLGEVTIGDQIHLFETLIKSGSVIKNECVSSCSVLITEKGRKVFSSLDLG